MRACVVSAHAAATIVIYLLQRNVSFLFEHGCDRGADSTVLSQSNPTHQEANAYLSGGTLKKNNKKLFPLDPAENEAYFTDKRIMPLIF